MKNLQQLFMTLVFVLGLVSVQAQPNNGFDCDCPEPTEDDVVCVDTDFGVIAFPSACIAECMGLEVIEGDCTLEDMDDEIVIGDPMDCDCPEPTAEEVVCVEADLGLIIAFPSACYAECLGFEVVEGDCTLEDWDNQGDWDDEYGDDLGNDFDCDCEEPTEEDVVCVETDFGTMPFPSACIAECFGLTVVEGDCNIEDLEDQGDWDDEYGDDWGNDFDCDCEEPTEEDIVCVEAEFGLILAFPSACIAECFGYTVVDGDCNIEDWEDQGEWEEGNEGDFDCDCEEPTEDDLVCVETEFGIIPFPSACIAECFGFEVVEGGCDEFEDEGTEFLMSALEEAAFEGEIAELVVFPNPASDFVSLSIEAKGEGVVSVQVLSITGQLMIDEQLTISSGIQRTELSLNDLPAGSYLVRVIDQNGQAQTERLVKTN